MVNPPKRKSSIALQGTVTTIAVPISWNLTVDQLHTQNNKLILHLKIPNGLAELTITFHKKYSPTYRAIITYR